MSSRTLVLFVLSVFVAVAIAHRGGHHDHDHDQQHQEHQHFDQQSTEEEPVVEAPVGKIRGSLMRSKLGRKIYSFRSIRYGQPPVGQQRFQVAIPVADWSDVYDGTQEGPGCPTLTNTTNSEDCLRLNVYTTRLPSKSAKGGHFRGRPVLVFFHPGGFYTFSGQSRFFGPQYLSDEDIVIVTVNYRQGILGFLATGDSLAPGNVGFKDQVAALRWVQRNIGAFGGDANSVTIGGYSVGSFSVLLHMLSPMSKGLFHRAIAMSGSPLKFSELPTEQKWIAKKQAELLNCPTDTTGSIILCLNTKPVEDFTRTIPDFFEWYGDPMLIWAPVVEPEVHGVERFLVAQPDQLIKEGKINEVPLIIGTTSDEFNGISILIYNTTKDGNYSFLDTLNEKWETIAPIGFMYERNTARSRHISREIMQHFFGGRINRDNYQNLAQIYTDLVEIFPMRHVTKLFSEHMKTPVYNYQFTFGGRYSFYMVNETTAFGRPVHHDDLQYLFYMSALFPYFNETDPELEMVKRYTAMWGSFIRTGEPVPRDNELFGNLVWEIFDRNRENYMEINLNPSMKQGIFPERMQFWDRVFPQLPLPKLPNSVKN